MMCILIQVDRYVEPLSVRYCNIFGILHFRHMFGTLCSIFADIVLYTTTFYIWNEVHCLKTTINVRLWLYQQAGGHCESIRIFDLDVKQPSAICFLDCSCSWQSCSTCDSIVSLHWIQHFRLKNRCHRYWKWIWSYGLVTNTRDKAYTSNL